MPRPRPNAQARENAQQINLSRQRITPMTFRGRVGPTPNVPRWFDNSKESLLCLCLCVCKKDRPDKRIRNKHRHAAKLILCCNQQTSDNTFSLGCAHRNQGIAEDIFPLSWLLSYSANETVDENEGHLLIMFFTLIAELIFGKHTRIAIADLSELPSAV